MNDTLLALAAQRYGLTPEQLHPLRGGNFATTYGFTREGADYVLKVSPPDADLDAAAMRAIWAWVHHLDAHGASVAGPIPSMAGRLVEAIEQEEGPFLATAVRKAPGILAEELPYEQWSDALFRAWGRTAGKMHAIAQTYAPEDPALRRPEWDQGGNCFSSTIPDALANTAIAHHHAQVRATLSTLPKDPSSHGMIHTDFHAANFFVEPETGVITVFDFDDCSRGWYAMDIAMALFDVLVVYPRQDRLAFAEHFLGQYIEGYLLEEPLDAFWVAQLPHFLKLLEINIYTQVYAGHDPADTTSWVGKFLAHDRKGRIERGEPYVDLDFSNSGAPKGLPSRDLSARTLGASRRARDIPNPIVTIVPFHERHLPAFAAWFSALPNNNAWSEAWVRYKTLDDETYDPALMLAAEIDDEPAGFLIANIADEKGWVRAFIVHPEKRRQGIGTRLFDAAERALRDRGISEIEVGWALPRYFLPGIDVSYTPAIAFLDQRGYETSRETRVNMDVMLTGRDFDTSGTEARLREHGIEVRRARAEDREEIEALCFAEGHGGWAVETELALAMAPVPVFVACAEGSIRGIATHSLAGPIHFGPMLTAGETRGLGIGTVLLKRCLLDWQRSGVERCEIMWAGPIAFYARTVGATVGRAFWTFRKAV